MTRYHATSLGNVPSILKEGLKAAKSISTVNNGGWVDVFYNNIPPEYIDGICNAKDECYDVEDWLKLFGDRIGE